MMNKGHLEKELFSLVRKNTSNQIQKKRTIDFRAKKEFSFVLTKEIIKKYHLWEWFKNYKKEAMVSTGGIRGPQKLHNGVHNACCSLLAVRKDLSSHDPGHDF